MKNINDLIFSFKEHLAVLNRSPATIEIYTEHAQIFLKTIAKNDTKQITTRMIEKYIVGLYDYKTKDGSPYKTSTICVKVRSIKRFFEFLEKSNLIFINPAEFISEPKQPKDRIKITLTPQEAKLILDQPNLGTLTGIRDRSILEVFYSTGIRMNELCKLTVFDADLQGSMLRINKGKGAKDRVVPLGKHAVKFLREYIAKVRPRLSQKRPSNRYLFINCYGGAINEQVVGIMIRNYASAVKVKKQVTAHTFRHTFATLLVKNGADIVAVQKMLGHTELKTTEKYLRTLGIDVKAVHKKTHPREKDKEDVKAAKPQIQKKKGSYVKK